MCNKPVIPHSANHSLGPLTRHTSFFRSREGMRFICFAFLAYLSLDLLIANTWQILLPSHHAIFPLRHPHETEVKSSLPTALSLLPLRNPAPHPIVPTTPPAIPVRLVIFGLDKTPLAPPIIPKNKVSPLPAPVHADPDHAGHRAAGVAATLVRGDREVGT